MRSASIAPKSTVRSSASCPCDERTSTIGDSGGTYQTIGIVRYSGCSGRATRYVLASA